ncbi:MAG: HNH endonuclease, partial [Candidatus Polarisedimenticolia bacterium]
ARAAGPAPALDPRPLDDAAWHASLRREPGTARRRIIYYGHLAAAWLPTPGALPAPDVFLRLRLPDQVAVDLLEAIEAARAGLSARVDAVPWDEPWPDSDPSPSLAAARTFSTRSRRVPAWVGLLALLEDFACTWDAGGRRDLEAADLVRPPEVAHPADAACATPRRPGVTPAAPRRPGDAVYIRDGWRCTAPACTSARNLEDHHIVYRSQQGNDDLCNRTCLCRFHHQRGEHGRLASCTGTAPLGITWRLGPPDLATWYRNERRIELADRQPAGGAT